jgi:hypothetical protein
MYKRERRRQVKTLDVEGGVDKAVLTLSVTPGCQDWLHAARVTWTTILGVIN